MKLRKRLDSSIASIPCFVELRTKAFIIIIILVLSCCHLYQQWTSVKKSNEAENDVLYFDLRNKRKVFNHLDYINPSKDVKPRGFLSIDQAHRQGKIHQGNVLYMVDTSLHANETKQDPKILIVKRSANMVTCPSAWFTIGEHTYRDESPIETVHRGIKEEMGIDALEYVLEHGRISSITENPVYYERDYGESNDGRIDRQVTYLWLVEMNVRDVKDNLYKSIDEFIKWEDEIADHKWISLETFSSLLNRGSDLGADRMSFCHETIVSILRLGLEELLLMKE